jgi:hypothetical protein
MHYFHFNYLAWLVASVVQWIIGALWYSLLFAKPWMALTNHTPGERPKGAVADMVQSFIGGLVMNFVLVHLVVWGFADTVQRGVFVGFICWLGFIAVSLYSEKLYEQRPTKLFLINAGYWLVSLVVSGAILACWR